MGKVAILSVGFGFSGASLFAQIEAMKRGWVPGLESTPSSFPGLRDNLASIEDLAPGGWDLKPENAYQILESLHSSTAIEKCRSALFRISPFRGVTRGTTEQTWPEYSKAPMDPKSAVKALRQDIREFMRENFCDRGVMIWGAGPIAEREVSHVHESLASFEWGLERNHPSIEPFELYACAALKEQLAFVAPSALLQFPCFAEMACEWAAPLLVSDSLQSPSLSAKLLEEALLAEFAARMKVRGLHTLSSLGEALGQLSPALVGLTRGEPAIQHPIKERKVASWELENSLPQDVRL